MGGERECAKHVEFPWVGGAESVHVVVYFAGGVCGGSGGEEVEPGVCEADDGGGDVVLAHEV